MIKLLATDLDGTLLDSSGRIPRRNAEAVRLAMEKGVTVCATTGRIHATGRRLSDELGLNGPLIAVNGAWVQKGDELIERHIIPVENIEQGIRLGQKYGACPMTVCRDKMTYLTEHKEYLSKIISFYDSDTYFQEMASVEAMLDSARTFGSERLSFICFDLERIGALRQELEKVYHETLEVTSSWASNLEISTAGVTKGFAVARMAHKMGIGREQVMTIGDHDNDISMLEYAGVSVAMGNACDAAKRAARYETDTNDNLGFAKALERFILS